MRTRQLLTVAAMLVFAASPGCTDHKDPAAPTRHGLELHLTTSFENDFVRVTLDECQVFGGSATTDDRVGLSFVVHTTAYSGSHVIDVNVGEHHQRLRFELQEYTYLIVRRDCQTGELSIRATGQRPIYD
jgi:hypothetical protein